MGRLAAVGWQPSVGVAGWLISFAVGIIFTYVAAGILFATGFDMDQISVALIPAAPVMAGLVAVAVAAWARGGTARSLFGPARPGVGWLLTAVVAGVLCFIAFNVLFGAVVVYVLDLLGIDTPAVQETLRDAAATPGAVVVVAVSVTIAAPLGEELLYRGLLLQALLSRFRPSVAIWLSALAFAVGHMAIGAPLLSNAVLALLIFPLGAVLAWSFVRSGTLWVPIVIHSVFNAITVALMAAGLA